MNGLILKDLLNARKSLMMMVPIAIVFCILFSFDSPLTVMLMCPTFLVSLSGFSIDEYDSWNSFAVSVGVGRSSIIGSKFVISAIYAIIGTAMATAIVLVFTGVSGDTVGADDMLMFVCMSLGAGLIVGAAVCTAHVFLKAERAQVASSFITGACIALSVIFGSMVDEFMGDLSPGIGINVLPFGIIIVCVLYLLANRRFASKDL